MPRSYGRTGADSVRDARRRRGRSCRPHDRTGGAADAPAALGASRTPAWLARRLLDSPRGRGPAATAQERQQWRTTTPSSGGGTRNASSAKPARSSRPARQRRSASNGNASARSASACAAPKSSSSAPDGAHGAAHHPQETDMLKLALIFLVIAL